MFRDVCPTLNCHVMSPAEGAIHWADKRCVCWGCLLDCGRWGLNRAVLCVPAEVGSVCQDQNTQASVPLTARLAYPSCICLPSNAAQTVCEWGSFFKAAHPPALFPPNKHCTGNCRDIWDFWGVPVERRRGLEQGCSLWHLGGEGRAKTQRGGREGRVWGDPKKRAWPWFGWLAGWAASVKCISTDEQVQVTQFPLTPSGVLGPRVRAKDDLARHRKSWPGLKVKRKWYSVTQSKLHCVSPNR